MKMNGVEQIRREWLWKNDDYVYIRNWVDVCMCVYMWMFSIIACLESTSLIVDEGHYEKDILFAHQSVFV